VPPVRAVNLFGERRKAWQDSKMLRLRLKAADVARIRFGQNPHPVGTAILASQALRQPTVAAAAPVLTRRVRAAAAPLRPLFELLPPTGFLPDFLTPRDGLDSVEAGLAAIRSAPATRIRADVAAALAHLPATAMRRRLAAADPEVLEAVVAALRRFFRDVLAPDWPVLVEEHRHQVGVAAHRYALSGVDGVLSGLHPAVRWRAGVLDIDTWSTGLREVTLDGRGVVLVPSPFAGSRPRVLVDPDRPALVVYPAGSPATLTPGPAADDPLAGLIGRTRGAILRVVARPGRHTTSTVGLDAGVSASSSSEHLKALRAAGLVSSHRDGGAVVHRPTELCAALLAGRTQGTGICRVGVAGDST
jgi:DNA-binding transcriptional ArsR family regulator